MYIHPIKFNYTLHIIAEGTCKYPNTYSEYIIYSIYDALMSGLLYVQSLFVQNLQILIQLWMNVIMFMLFNMHAANKKIIMEETQIPLLLNCIPHILILLQNKFTLWQSFIGFWSYVIYKCNAQITHVGKSSDIFVLSLMV